MYHQINWSNLFFNANNDNIQSTLSLTILVSCASSDQLSREKQNHTGCIFSVFLKVFMCMCILRLSALRIIFSHWLHLLVISRQSAFGRRVFECCRKGFLWRERLSPDGAWSHLDTEGPSLFSALSISSFIIGNIVFCYSWNSWQLPTIVMLVKEWSIKWKFQILKVWCHITNHHHQHPIPSARPKINAWIKLI